MSHEYQYSGSEQPSSENLYISLTVGGHTQALQPFNLQFYVREPQTRAFIPTSIDHYSAGGQRVYVQISEVEEISEAFAPLLLSVQQEIAHALCLETLRYLRNESPDDPTILAQWEPVLNRALEVATEVTELLKYLQSLANVSTEQQELITDLKARLRRLTECIQQG